MQVLEPQNVDPSMVQMTFLDDVVHSLLKGENIGITSRRRSRSSQNSNTAHVSVTYKSTHISPCLYVLLLLDEQHTYIPGLTLCSVLYASLYFCLVHVCPSVCLCFLLDVVSVASFEVKFLCAFFKIFLKKTRAL